MAQAETNKVIVCSQKGYWLVQYSEAYQSYFYREADKIRKKEKSSMGNDLWEIILTISFPSEFFSEKKKKVLLASLNLDFILS